MLQRAGGSAAIPTMRLPLNAAMHALPSPRFLQTNVVMLPWRPCHYNLSPKQGGNAAMPTLPLPPSCKQQQGGNAAMPTLPLTPCFPKQGGNAAIPTWQLPHCFQEQGGSAEIPTWPYHPARKSKVVMQPFPPGHYHFALESMFGRGGKTSTEIGPGITSGVIPRVSPNSSLPLSPRCPQN